MFCVQYVLCSQCRQDTRDVPAPGARCPVPTSGARYLVPSVRCLVSQPSSHAAKTSSAGLDLAMSADGVGLRPSTFLRISLHFILQSDSVYLLIQAIAFSILCSMRLFILLFLVGLYHPNNIVSILQVYEVKRLFFFCCFY